MLSKQQFTLLAVAIFMALCLSATICLGQDESYDDEGYGNQGANNNQGDSDNYGPGNEDGYANSNAPNQQQNLDSDGTNNQVQGNNNYNPQANNDADDDYQGDDNSAAAASLKPTITRIKRSLNVNAEPLTASASEPKHRVKRHGKYYIGPVYTYVKTDKHANFKWGVKHKVGKKHHG